MRDRYVLNEYKIIKIPKANGKFRNIYIVNDEKKKALYSYFSYLESKLRELDKGDVCYAFVKDKNCALNAFRHIGYQHTLSMDIVDFFGSISREHVKEVLSEEIIKNCFIEGAPQQGLPTSPLIANIAFTSVDNKIIALLQTMNIDCLYTRYADDLIFSFDDLKLAPKIKIIVTRLLNSNGFRINASKTKLQSLKNGRIIINGVAIDENGIYATRKTKKKLRAAIHQYNLRSARGLLEWAACKFPKALMGITNG